ncbi:multicopper oxidase family protein [Myxococcus virescens]|uniref:Metallo-oxidoreductase n=1 Tax=Myxococcus virescens TaxID=83456 RepID=A0A511H5Q3_9BACT|nr:multicopper oxidase family protein [Myxococcus virescens]GEL68852.1 metallo-oxidoreductase [Myxococcus virescens]SDE46203.1 Multicopper oxidase with three cupredoxin domains (includes cell division protein FtsP and spore coat protein CotA) [Myxococcus virescens]
MHRNRWFIGAALVALLAMLAALGLGQEDDAAMATLRQPRVAPPYPEDIPSTGRVREFELVAAPTALPLLDGRSLEVWAYNGQVPGPTLRATHGDTVRVRFTNKLPQPTTIHWHGIRLPNGMDGVPGVTQPPIPPGGTFVYEFKVKDAGTYWFHPHLRGSEQVERGLFGVLIVEDPKPGPFSRELVWVLDDWRLDAGGQIDGRFNTRHDLAHDGRWGQVSTVNGAVQPEVPLQPGERVRLRMVNVANGRVFAPSFEGLGASVIAIDGLATDRPLPASRLELAPGNRVDLDFTVPEALSNPRLEVMDHFTRRPFPLATLVVSGDVVRPPEVAAVAPPPSPDLSPARALLPAETFRLNARRGGPFGIEWTINDEAFHHEGEHASAHHKVYRLPAHQWATLRFVNESSRLHPMHVHGQFFRVVARNGASVDEGHWRDTVLIRPRETVDVAMFPQDVGAWMLHCHIQEHAEAGMMTLVDVHAEGSH